MKLRQLVFFILLFLLPNCSRYANWFKTTYTGGQIHIPDRSCIQKYMCSKAIYDQGQTIGLFDAIWLTEPVRKYFVDLQATRLNLSCQEKEDVLNKQIACAQESISFYVLVPLADQDTLCIPGNCSYPWAISLSIDGVCVTPDIVKILPCLPPEYIFMLRKEDTLRFRQVYQVCFNTHTACGTPLITPNTQEIKLIISSIKYSTCCIWRATPSGWCLS